MEKLDSDTLRRHKGVSFPGVGTCFICHDGKGKLLLTKRSMNTRDEQGRWEIGGGGLKWGCSALDNVKREIKEELCAEAKSIEFLGYRDVFRENHDGETTHWLQLDFLVLLDPKEVKIGEPDQCDDLGWFTLSKLPSPLHSQLKKELGIYSKELKRVLKA